MKYFIIKLKDNFDIDKLTKGISNFILNKEGCPYFITGEELAQILLDSNINIDD